MNQKLIPTRVMMGMLIGALLSVSILQAVYAQEATEGSYAERLAMRLAGEGSFAMEPLACTALNRLRAGWNPEKLLDRKTTPFYAPDVPVNESQIEIVEQVLDGERPCDERLYYALGGGDTWRPHDGDAVLVVHSGEKSVWFFDK